MERASTFGACSAITAQKLAAKRGLSVCYDQAIHDVLYSDKRVPSTQRYNVRSYGTVANVVFTDHGKETQRPK